LKIVSVMNIMSKLSSPDGSRTSFSEKCSHNTCDDSVVLLYIQKMTVPKKLKRCAGMLVK
jgi:hypothetical protein